LKITPRRDNSRGTPNEEEIIAYLDQATIVYRDHSHMLRVR
jgi:hypothetical protein